MPNNKFKTVAVVTVILVVVCLLCNDFELPDWIKARGTRSQGDNPELRMADLRGRLHASEEYSLEVSNRLDAYQTRFNSPDAQLLDEVFLDPQGYCSVHPLRREWAQMRSELREFTEKHSVFLKQLREAAADLTPDKVDQYWTLPERANAWSKYLDDAIRQRSSKFAMWDQVVRRVHWDQNHRRIP